MPKLEEEEARKALLALVEEKTCWGRDAADDLIFKNIEHTAAFHYILETYTESRSTKWVHEPYVDQIIDGPMNGPAPAPWNIPVEMPTMFRNAVQHVEVPHTASVKPCHNCRGSGYRQCVRCSGRGTTMCSWCGGDGWRIVSRYDGDHSYTDHEICYSCGGDGRKRCSPCDGSGRVMCRTCIGQGQLKCYIRLTVEWKNHMEDYIVERTALPDELIRNVTGKTVFDEESPKVCPIKCFPVAEVNSGSGRLVQRHAHAYSQERLHRQRHQIRVTPVVELQCQYEDESFTYFVYGFENKVYAPDYPMQCCWGCSIL
ncbi:protein SSUH2 homolog [Diadema antillarum]|uniref:protein SSUH2 homolog n=1 Tax=Diadema antillarum TaxID=105358 RepID=UPI003A8BDFF0